MSFPGFPLKECGNDDLAQSKTFMFRYGLRIMAVRRGEGIAGLFGPSIKGD